MGNAHCRISQIIVLENEYYPGRNVSTFIYCSNLFFLFQSPAQLKRQCLQRAMGGCPETRHVQKAGFRAASRTAQSLQGLCISIWLRLCFSLIYWFSFSFPFLLWEPVREDIRLHLPSTWLLRRMEFLLQTRDSSLSCRNPIVWGVW